MNKHVEIATTHPYLQDESVAPVREDGAAFNVLEFLRTHDTEVWTVVAGACVAAFGLSQPEDIRNKILLLDGLVVSGAVVALALLNHRTRDQAK